MNIKKQNNKPEEEVRRFIINYLIRNFKYDKSLFRIEQKISENTSERSFRPDVIVYDNNYNPFLIIECKARNINITEETVFQIQKYNKFLNSKYLLITNGLKIFCWKLNGNTYIKSEIPYFQKGDN